MNFRDDGYVVIRDLFDRNTIAMLAHEAEQLQQREDLILANNLRCRFHPHHQSGKNLLEALDPIIDISPIAADIAASSDLHAILRDLMGDVPMLFKDKLIFKPAGSSGYALHQDYIHWEGFPASFTTVAVAIDAADSENGCLEVYPGLHRQGALAPLDGDWHDLPATAVKNVQPVALQLNPGDVAIFGCFVPHRSVPNQSFSARRQLYLSYNARFDGGDQRMKHYQQFHAWMKQRFSEFGAANLMFR